MKKQLFIYSNFDFSVKNAGVTRMLYYARSLASENITVFLLTCSFSKISKNNMTEIYPNVFVLKKKNNTNTFIGTIKFIGRLYKFSLDFDTNKAFLFYPSPLVYLEVLALIYLKLLKKCNVFYELNEVRKYSSTFQPKLSLENPIYSIKKLIYKTTFSLLELLLKTYDGVICISTSIQQYGNKYNPNTIRIPILTDPYNSVSKTNKLYSVQPSFNIGFSGSIHPIKENLTNFYIVLGLIHKQGINFTLNLCGYFETKHKTQLEKLAKELEIESKIIYYGNLGEQELSSFLVQQQLLVIPRGKNLQNNYGFSTKLSDYLNHNVPVFITNVSDNGLFIEDNVNGFIVEPDNNILMFEKLLNLINNYKNIDIKTILKNARVTSIKYFYFENYNKKLIDFLFSGC